MQQNNKNTPFRVISSTHNSIFQAILPINPSFLAIGSNNNFHCSKQKIFVSHTKISVSYFKITIIFKKSKLSKLNNFTFNHKSLNSLILQGLDISTL